MNNEEISDINENKSQFLDKREGVVQTNSSVAISGF